MQMSPSAAQRSALKINRLEALSDGVFAIAMTLLVLELRVPEVEGTSLAELPSRIMVLWPRFLSYALSFVVLGIYWIGHHNQFHYIKRSNRTFMWITILFLMCVSFIPFATALLGTYTQQPIATTIYGSTLVATGLALYLQWWYATTNYRLVDPDLPPQVMSLAARRILFAPCVYLFAIGISFISIELSFLLYIAVPLFYILPSHIDRHMTVAPIQPANPGERAAATPTQTPHRHSNAP
jgi:uncharacterized membrane protein